MLRRLADTLEQSAALADAHAERYERAGRSDDFGLSAREGSGRWVCSSVVASGLGVREVCSGLCRRLLELFAPLSRCSIFDLVSRVVVSESPLRSVRQQPEKADVGVGHCRVLGSGAGIERADTWGSSMGRSSGPRRRQPTALSLVICWGGSPHSGQATMYAAAAGVKRSRQRGQQSWVITDSF